MAMKIAISGSMAFAQDMFDIKTKLEKLGHIVEIPQDAESYADGTFQEEDKWKKLKNDVIKKYFGEIGKSDAILVINKDKNGVANYIGGNSLLELGFAHVLDKKKYLLNPIPDLNYKDEIEAMEPTILNNNLDLIQ